MPSSSPPDGGETASPAPADAVPRDPAVFADLATAPGGCFPIADTARRAITLVQLARIAEHVGRRLGYRYVEPVMGEKGTVTTLGRWER